MLAPNDLLPTIEEIDAELARRSLAEFSRQAWHVLEPTTPLEWNWHLDAICQHVQALLVDWIAVAEAVRDGKEPPAQRFQNLVINVPPGSGKSRFVSVFAPAWMWVRWPSWRAIFLSGNPRVALRDAEYCRTLLDSEWHQRSFRPEWRLSNDQNAKSLYRNTAGGFRMSASVGSRIIGDRGDALFTDDPNDADEVTSDLVREGVNGWWDQSASNRVNDLRYSTRCLIMQRLHERDLTGYGTKGWATLRIRQEYEAKDGEPTVIGWRDPRETPGELMFPARFPAGVLVKEKTRLGSAGYAGQHQQRPVPAGGGLFKSAWFRYWRKADDRYLLIQKDGTFKSVAIADCERFAVLDVAGTKKAVSNDPDYSVLQVWDKTPDNELVLVEQWRDRVQLPDVASKAVAMVRTWDCPVLLVESNGIGLGVIQSIEREGVAVVGVKSVADKVSRSQTAQIRMEGGFIYFPHESAFKIELEAELTSFPVGGHDDQVDDVSTAAIHVHQGLDLSGILDGGEYSVGAA